MESIRRHDGYRWDDLTGWKSYRMLRPGRGMYHDVKRRFPYYWSDIKDGFNYRTASATVRIFFVNLLPALAFTLDMERRTGGYFGINEALFSSALAALVFSTLSAQPLTVVGITGLISLFNYTIYDMIARHDAALYPQFMVWVSIWTAITHWIASFGNISDYMRFITDFSSNTFGAYVGIIYMEKGIQELIDSFVAADPRAGFLSIVIALCYWATVYGLEFVGTTALLTPSVRGLLADYAFPIATIFWTGFVHIPNSPLRGTTELPFLPTTTAFHTTTGRSWLVDFWSLEVKWIFVALPIGILLTMLFYYDHNVSSLTAQAKQFPLKKPAGFHWDFFLLGCTSFIGGILGLPLPNGLVPQAPVHTDACTEYKDMVQVVHTDEDEGVEHRYKFTIPVRVAEQRVSHFLMGLGFVGMMTGPLLTVLRTMPRALFAGVFLVVGWGSLEGNNITKKLLYLLTEARFIDPANPFSRFRKPRIAYFVFWQCLAVACTVGISQTLGAIGFPVLILLLIPFRWVVMPRMFTVEELEIMDALTADNPVVLASLGGKPVMPERRLEAEKEGRDLSDETLTTGNGEEDAEVEMERGGKMRARRQRAGSYTRA